jgi:hypothetical protein
MAKKKTTSSKQSGSKSQGKGTQSKATPRKPKAKQPVTVAVCGTGEVSLTNHVGRPVGEIRQAMTTILNLASNAAAFISGKAVKESYIIKQGDKLEFVQQSGRKG